MCKNVNKFDVVVVISGVGVATVVVIIVQWLD